VVFCVYFKVIPTLWYFGQKSKQNTSVGITPKYHSVGITSKIYTKYQSAGITPKSTHNTSVGITTGILFRFWSYSDTVVFCVDFGVIPTLWYFV
jgi:hypothetical protein